MTLDRAAATGFEPFLAAVVAAPDDDLPRLIAADWLDEYGEPGRAEFIRVQCEADALEVGRHHDDPAAERSCVLCARLSALRRRERELLEAHGFSQYPGSKWVDAECPELWQMGDRGATFAFSRGFVSEITCTAQGWISHADAILAACPIRNAKDGVVRLTTWPDFLGRVESVDRNEGTARLRLGGRSPTHEETLAYLTKRYSGVRFELPPAPLLTGPPVSWATTADTTPLADFRRVMRAMEELGRDVVVSPRVLDADFS